MLRTTCPPPVPCDMSPDHLFLACTLSAVPLRLLLLCAPSRRGTKRVVQGAFPFLLLALAYLWAHAAEGEPAAGAGFTSLAGLILLFSSKEAMLAAWIRFIAMDLFVGAWMVRDAARHGIRHLWVVPSLLVTFALGPPGLASYLVLRWARTGVLSLEAPGEGEAAVHAGRTRAAAAG